MNGTHPIVFSGNFAAALANNVAACRFCSCEGRHFHTIQRLSAGVRHAITAIYRKSQSPNRAVVMVNESTNVEPSTRLQLLRLELLFPARNDNGKPAWCTIWHTLIQQRSHLAQSPQYGPKEAERPAFSAFL